MSLTGKIQLTNNFGELSSFPDAYVKLTSISGIKSKATAVVSIFKEKDGRLLDERRVDFTYDLSEGAPNLMQQAYEAVKQSDDFKDMVEC